MNFTTYINEINIKTRWNATLGDGSMTALMTPAPAKKALTNTSSLIDGEEVAGGVRPADKRELSLVFHISATGYADFNTKLNGLIEELRKGVAVFRTTLLPGVKYRLDYDSCTLTQLCGLIGKAVIKFTEHNPADRI